MGDENGGEEDTNVIFILEVCAGVRVIDVLVIVMLLMPLNRREGLRSCEVTKW